MGVYEIGYYENDMVAARRRQSAGSQLHSRLVRFFTAIALIPTVLLAIFAPWLAMFLRGKVLQGILCIILHLTIIGWIPATIWALVVTRRETA